MHHVNCIILIGRVLPTRTFENNRGVRLQMRRAVFHPPRSDGSSDPVNVILLEAVTRGQVVNEGDELQLKALYAIPIGKPLAPASQKISFPWA